VARWRGWRLRSRSASSLVGHRTRGSWLIRRRTATTKYSADHGTSWSTSTGSATEGGNRESVPAPRLGNRRPSSRCRRSAMCRTPQRQPTSTSVRSRRILPVPARCGGGGLTERTPVVQPRRRERVKVAPKPPSIVCSRIGGSSGFLPFALRVYQDGPARRATERWTPEGSLRKTDRVRGSKKLQRRLIMQ